MYNSLLSKTIPFPKQFSAGTSCTQNFSSDSDVIDTNTMSVNVFVKFPGGRIAVVQFPQVASHADVMRSLARAGYSQSQILLNSRVLVQGRALSPSHSLCDGDVMCIVPRLLGGVTPRGQPDKENHEPQPNPFNPFAFEEFGSRFDQHSLFELCIRTNSSISPRFIDELSTPRTPAFGLHLSFAALEHHAPPMLHPGLRACSLEIEDSVAMWGLITPGQRMSSEASEPQREIKEELLEVEDVEDLCVAVESSAEGSNPQNFSIAIVGVTAVAGIERVIDLLALHAMSGSMFSPPKASSAVPAANPGSSDFKNSVQFNLQMPRVPRPVSGRLFKNGKITLSSVKTFGVSEVFDAIISEVKQAHVRAKAQGAGSGDVIVGWTDGSPIAVINSNVRLSLQLQFQLPFPVNYKKMIRQLKCGSQFIDSSQGSFLIRCGPNKMFSFHPFFVPTLPVSDVRPNLPCGAGFMFATDFPQCVAPSQCTTAFPLSNACAVTAGSLSLWSTAAKYKRVAAATFTSFPSSSNNALASTRSSAASVPSSSPSPSRKSWRARAGAPGYRRPRLPELSRIKQAGFGRRRSVNKCRKYS